jgi:hypothetical protein
MESVAIITYGSLIDPDVLESEFGNISYVKIRLSGYRRHFAQRAEYREGEDGENCVASIERSQSDWVSALLVTGLTEDEYEAYLQREKGYNMEEIAPELIHFYDTEWDLDRFDDILAPIGNNFVSSLPNPVPSYVQSCVEGAFKHGTKFGSDFVLTTFRRRGFIHRGISED